MNELTPRVTFRASGKFHRATKSRFGTSMRGWSKSGGDPEFDHPGWAEIRFTHFECR